jgi:hypothetical protein
MYNDSYQLSRRGASARIVEIDGRIFHADDWIRIQTYIVLDDRAPQLIADVDLRPLDVARLVKAADDLMKREADHKRA